MTGAPTSLRGLNKEAGWLQDEVSPRSYGTTKNPGSFHLPANPPSMCQPYPLAGSPRRGKAAVVATSNTQMWQVSEEDNFNLHRTERASLILHFDTWGTGPIARQAGPGCKGAASCKAQGLGLLIINLLLMIRASSWDFSGGIVDEGTSSVFQW